ncbi:MAG: prepilin-type N-terminal cleavage/methylation domain-containing protein [Phycisphaerales bacterium]|nr:prepilin-type N-terminal cleavage/methylation domain-containing protein [Phycisphaerales bacterium]
MSRRTRRTSRRGFSMVELLLALAIVSMVLTSAMVALDAAFKGYRATTDSASTHVVSRIVMHRVVAMIRNGTEFGPFPSDVLDPAQNPLDSDFIEFVSFEDEDTGIRQVSRIEFREAADGEDYGAVWFMLYTFENGIQQGETVEARMIPNVEDASFTLEYDVGPRLKRATVDLLIRPNDDLDPIGVESRNENNNEPIRLVGSATPRRL